MKMSVVVDSICLTSLVCIRGVRVGHEAKISVKRDRNPTPLTRSYHVVRKADGVTGPSPRYYSSQCVSSSMSTRFFPSEYKLRSARRHDQILATHAQTLTERRGIDSSGMCSSHI